MAYVSFRIFQGMRWEYVTLSRLYAGERERERERERVYVCVCEGVNEKYTTGASVLHYTIAYGAVA